MVDGGRKTANSAVEEKASVKHGVNENSTIGVEDESFSDSEIAQLRGRWELASILNFLSVFEPVIGCNLKLTAEEIESGLVKPNGLLAQLHIKLLQGIPPVSKTLNVSDAWVTVLCKKLAMWWPWVAEGEVPLTAANGKEISGYKELDPTNRLLILKALCEIRADQDDAVSYVNDALKNGTKVSSFRKEKIGGDGNTTYWYDASKITGHRLYKEVSKIVLKTPTKGKAPKEVPATCFQWETLATNLKEFQKIVDELSSSKFVAEVAVGKTIDTDVLPAIEKYQKNKERALKRKQRQEKVIDDLRSYAAGFTRSCRSRRTVSYTFDDYDRAIDEAIDVTKKGKARQEQRNECKPGDQEKNGSDGISNKGIDPSEKGDSSPKETESDRLQEAGYNDDMDDDDDDYDGERDDHSDDNESSGSDEEKDNIGNKNHANDVLKHFGSRWSMRLAGFSANNPVAETGNLDTKNRLRQRPTRNSALAHIVPDSDDHDLIVPDSDDENLSKHVISAHEDTSQAADSEEQGNFGVHEGSRKHATILESILESAFALWFLRALFY